MSTKKFEDAYLEAEARNVEQIERDVNEYVESGEQARNIDASLAEMEANAPWYEKLFEKIFG